MTKDEAIKVAKVAIQADNECVVCGEQQIIAFQDVFPEHKETFQKVWDERNDYIYG